MSETPAPLTRELLEWIAAAPRTYADTMAAWTSNCPRHPAWDDALADGLIEVARRDVRLTERGRAYLIHARG